MFSEFKKDKNLCDYNLKSIWDLIELRKFCRSQLKKAVKYMDMPCVFYYVRLLQYIEYLIKLKWY